MPGPGWQTEKGSHGTAQVVTANKPFNGFSIPPSPSSPSPHGMSGGTGQRRISVASHPTSGLIVRKPHAWPPTQLHGRGNAAFLCEARGGEGPVSWMRALSGGKGQAPGFLMAVSGWCDTRRHCIERHVWPRWLPARLPATAGMFAISGRDEASLAFLEVHARLLVAATAGCVSSKFPDTRVVLKA